MRLVCRICLLFLVSSSWSLGCEVRSSAYDSEEEALPDAGPVCRDDVFEENDAFDSSATLLNATLYEAKICPYDPDFFKIMMVENSNCEIGVYFVNSDGNLDMTVYDATGAPVGSQSTESNEETLTFYVSQAAWYHLEVTGVEGAMNDYRIFAWCDCCS